MYTSFTYRAFYVIQFFDRHSGVCEVVALGTVSPRYDVTKFAGVHPGGTQILLEYAGKDTGLDDFKAESLATSEIQLDFNDFLFC